MHKKYIYLPISFLVVAAIGVITFEIPHFSLMDGFSKLIFLGLLLSICLAIFVWVKTKNNLIGEELILAVGSTLLFGFVICIAAISYGNRSLAYQNCEVKPYDVVFLEPRFASGYGNIEKGEIKPNQWILTIEDEGKEKTFTLHHSINIDHVTNTVNLEFCKGLLGTKYIKE